MIQKSIITKQFIRFGFVGLFNTIHYYAWYLVFLHLLSWPYIVAHVIAFILSMIGSFYLNTYFTYRTKPSLRKFLQFPLTYVVNITVATLALIIFVDIFQWNENVSPILAQLLTIPATFMVSKLILEQKQPSK